MSAPLPEKDRQQLESLVEEIGETRTLSRLHVCRNTLVRALSRRPLRAGTTLMIQGALNADARAETAR
jgi:hypothetical protein